MTEQPSIPRRVFNLAWPVISENFLQTMLGIVDTLFVARLGAEAIAGVGTALQVMFFVIAALSALSVGSAVLVAQAVGAGKLDRASHLARQTILWSVCFSAPLALIGLLAAAPIISIFRLEPAVADIAVEYLRVTMATVVVLVVLFIGGGALRGAGDSQTPMRVTAMANGLNVLLDWVLIFGVWGIPGMGAVGSAWATFISRLFAVILLLTLMWRGRGGITIRGSGRWAPEIPVARDVLRIGVPAALEQVLISSGFFALTMVVAGLGTAALAAHRIAFNALSLAFLPGIGFGIAATALVGQSLGARRLDEGEAVTKVAMRWALIWMGVMSLVMFMLSPQILRLFSNDPEILAQGVASLRVLALAQPFWALLFVYSGALRGLGNTDFPMRVNASGIWLAVLMGWGVVSFIGGGLPAVWTAFLVMSPLMAWLLFRRFHHEVRSIAPA